MKMEDKIVPTFENLRIADLIAIIKKNKAYYDDFFNFIKKNGYNTIKDFMNESSDEIWVKIVIEYLESPKEVELLNGIGKPFKSSKAPWFFIAWLLRDAPTQRLQPLLRYIKGDTPNEKKALLLNINRNFIRPLLNDDINWEWCAISEVMLARLEGSRRALKGNAFETLVRSLIRDVILEEKFPLKVYPKQVKIDGETYDVKVDGPKGSILFPVKTRETMGGGHALLFTRDIYKSINVARKNGFESIPIVIAESWIGDLDSLGVKHYIYININPNQLVKIEPILKEELRKIKNIFLTLFK